MTKHDDAVALLRANVFALVALSCGGSKEAAPPPAPQPASSSAPSSAPVASAAPTASSPIAWKSIDPRGEIASKDPSRPAVLEDGPLAWRPVRVEAPVPGKAQRDDTSGDPPRACGANEAREVACGSYMAPLCTDPRGYLQVQEWTGFYMPTYLRADVYGAHQDPLEKRMPFHGARPGEQRLVLDPQRTATYRASHGVSSETSSQCCFSRCTPIERGTGAANGALAADRTWIVDACVIFDVAGPRDVPGTRCPSSLRHGKDFGLIREYSKNACCYGEAVVTPAPLQPYRGRPYREGGAVRLPELAPGVAPGVLDVVASPDAAARWREDARLEHSSVAAFTALSLDLLAHGAPSSLVAAAHRAALEEIEHARIACMLSVSYGGEPVTPGALAIGAWRPSTLAELARSAILDGCVGEGAAALEAALESESAPHPEVARLLAAIARDEHGHAELAWRVVFFALEAGGAEVAAAIDACCTDLERARGGELRARVAREVVAPGLRRCLAPRVGEAQRAQASATTSA
jgi:hypothetical protein